MNYEELTDQSLLHAYADELDSIKMSQAESGRIQQELIRRMAERQATSIPSEKFICELKQVNSYDQASLTPLLEIFNKPELSSCYQPAYEEMVTVPAKWRIQQVIAAARRRGIEAQEVVDRARIPGAPSLSFKERQPGLRAIP